MGWGAGRGFAVANTGVVSAGAAELARLGAVASLDCLSLAAAVLGVLLGLRVRPAIGVI